MRAISRLLMIQSTAFYLRRKCLSNFSELQISSMIIVQVPFLMSTSPTNLTHLYYATLKTWLYVLSQLLYLPKEALLRIPFR